MRRWLKCSLPAKAALAVTLITVLALSSALSAVVIANISKDDAAAINAAGSLRMATYRLIWRLDVAAPRSTIENLKADMQQRLASPALRRVAERRMDSSTALAFQAINDHWQNVMLPALDHKTKSVFIAEAERFVLQLEKFISQLQRQSESRQNWQQGIQGAALILTVLILLVGLYQLQSSVIRPLKQLVDSARRFSRGDLNARITYRSEDELGQMAESFNAMAEVIKQSHLNLEDRINEKTRDLEQTNSTLQMLYQSSQSLATNAANIEQLNNLIDRFQQRFSHLHLTLCLHTNASTKRAQLIVLRGNQQRETCLHNNCSNCPRHQHPSVSIFAITSQGVRLGELRAIFSDGHSLRTWETELIQALANLIGTSLSLEQQREQENRLLLLAERATIARELHDSLAQALSYMKLQVSRMNTLIQRQEPTQHLLEVNEELRDGLNSAYRQLRELLTTFRLQIEGSGLESALEQTADEFAQRGTAEIIFNTPPFAFSLSAAEQIHLLQIVREALSNCVQHAMAEHIWVTISQHGESVRLLIEDDGCGISNDYDQRQHHGLNIMRERAESIGGQLSITNRNAGGTCIEMEFKAVFFSGHTMETLS
ncbi:HAMP domain-containing protein [Pseudomonas segetis]|uniref:Sensor protein n=1 Tax=Pseudomonas segetis TaxID=298908 RepID=A0A238ZM17_9PSED|nr:HAMP domain-containing protein [Pseudomonas segetis]SNR84169.1 two-component system, NarL family, nitrate/nitrite sensor histidine kinase NarX [Pseudomonas segetis]